MNTSLRDQLLKAGLIDKRQANEADRQERKQVRRPPPKQAPPVKSESAPAPRQVKSAVMARDSELNRRQREKAERKARLAEIKQLIESHRIKVDSDEFYNFVDGSKIRRIPVTASLRGRLGGGEVAIVRDGAHYALVPAAIAMRIRERNEGAVVSTEVNRAAAQSDATYTEFPIPDDLIW